MADQAGYSRKLNELETLLKISDIFQATGLCRKQSTIKQLYSLITAKIASLSGQVGQGVRALDLAQLQRAAIRLVKVIRLHGMMTQEWDTSDYGLGLLVGNGLLALCGYHAKLPLDQRFHCLIHLLKLDSELQASCCRQNLFHPIEVRIINEIDAFSNDYKASKIDEVYELLGAASQLRPLLRADQKSSLDAAIALNIDALTSPNEWSSEADTIKVSPFLAVDLERPLTTSKVVPSASTEDKHTQTCPLSNWYAQEEHDRVKSDVVKFTQTHPLSPYMTTSLNDLDRLNSEAVEAEKVKVLMAETIESLEEQKAGSKQQLVWANETIDDLVANLEMALAETRDRQGAEKARSEEWAKKCEGDKVRLEEKLGGLSDTVEGFEENKARLKKAVEDLEKDNARLEVDLAAEKQAVTSVRCDFRWLCANDADTNAPAMARY